MKAHIIWASDSSSYEDLDAVEGEFNTLEELLEFSEESRYPLIICKGRDGMHVTVYDDYVE